MVFSHYQHQNKLIIKNYTKNIIVCIHNNHPYSPIPKLSPETNYVTESHDICMYQNKYINHKIDNKNYIGIGDIKLLFFTKYPFESSVIDLIKVIRLTTEGFSIAWYKIGLIIMQKMDKIKLSETFYKVDKSWCHEIKINFNVVENWLPTLKKKDNKHKSRFHK